MLYAQPAHEFNLLNTQFSPYGTPFQCECDTAITHGNEADESNIYVLLEGAMAIERQSQGMLYEMLSSPGIFGLSMGIQPGPVRYTLVAKTACKGYFLPASVALQLLEKHQLWREAFYLMTWKNRVLEARDLQLIGTSSYNQIRSTLLTMAEWDEALRARIGVMNYIQRRTQISRSVIAEVLAALRQGNYIEMQKGKLVSINHLPHDY